MSTTAKLWVALKYCQGGDVATLLWLRTKNFMDRGVNIRDFSAFPFEEEYLYSPLTYIKPIDIDESPMVRKVGQVTYQIVEVVAQM